MNGDKLWQMIHQNRLDAKAILGDQAQRFARPLEDFERQ